MMFGNLFGVKPTDANTKKKGENLEIVNLYLHLFMSLISVILFWQEIDFVKFMEDPENPLSGSPPPPPSPQEEWASVEGSELLHHLTEATFDAFIKDREALVMFYAPCELILWGCN